MIILPVLQGLFAIEYVTPVLLLGFVCGLISCLIRGCPR